MVETYVQLAVTQTEDSTASRKRPFEGETANSENQNRTSDSKRSYTKQPLVKLLVPNYAAGAIIGKGGSNISDLQSRYGASIRISHNREFYPGTDERIVVLSGEISQIIDFHEYIIDKVNQDDVTSDKRPREDFRRQVVKIVLPNSTAGIIIGRGGASIKALQEDTKAKMMITSRDESKVVGERVLCITGTAEQRIEAAKEVIAKIAADPDNMANSHLKYSRGSHGHDIHNSGSGSVLTGLNIMHPSQNAVGNVIRNFPQDNIFSALSLNPLSVPTHHPISTMSQNPLSSHKQNPLSVHGMGGPPNVGMLGSVANQLADITPTSHSESYIKTTVQIEMEVPDVLIALFVGINGNILNEYIKFSGAKIQFSQKNDCPPGKKILTIHGDLNQTQIAYYLVNQKLTQVRKELATHSF